MTTPNDVDLELLKALPRHQPSDDLRRAVRVEMLERLEASTPVTLWQRALDQLAVPLALATLSALCLVHAASYTPLLR